MKVMCINDKSESLLGGNQTGFPIKYGEIVTALCCLFDNDSYLIKEYLSLNGVPVCYAKIRFVPLSDIDEMEYIKELTNETSSN